jgi:hypothetical protein
MKEVLTGLTKVEDGCQRIIIAQTRCWYLTYAAAVAAAALVKITATCFHRRRIKVGDRATALTICHTFRVVGYRNTGPN